MSRISIGVTALVICLTATEASAQPVAPPRPPVLEAVYACAQMEDDQARLACFDAATTQMHQAQTAGELIAIDRDQATTIQRESFGFSVPSIMELLPRFGSSDDAPDVVDLQVSEVIRMQDGRTTFVMADNQRWTQIEVLSSRNVREGDIVSIRRAAMGSYMLVSPRGGAGHRVRREQ